MVMKVYVRDCGLLHHLLGIDNGEQLLTDPKAARRRKMIAAMHHHRPGKSLLIVICLCSSVI